MKLHSIPLLLLLVLTALTYGELLTHTFLANWDDQVYITRNQAIQGLSFSNLKTAFTHYYVGNYAPVQIISYMLDFSLWGENPCGYLLANIVYHYCCGALLYLLLIRHGVGQWGAFVGAAVFLVHPVQVETVAWMSQRKNLLAMLFYLLAFHCYLHYRRTDSKSSRSWYLWSVILFSLSLLAKSVAVIFPVMLILHDQLVPPLRGRLKEHVDKVPYLLAAAVVAIIAIISQGSEYGGGRAEYSAEAMFSLPYTMLPVLVTYLKMVLWPDPAGLSIMYFPPVRSSFDAAVILAIGVVGVLLAVGLLLYRKNRPLFFWYGMFFLGLLPVSQLVPLVTLMNDRYLYFPMLGVAGLIASGFNVPWCNESRARVRAMLIVSLTLVALLAVTSHLRGRVWKNTVSLFSDAAEKSPDKATTWSRLAEGYVAEGDLEKARSFYEKAALLGQLDFDANNNLVQLYFELGDFSKAYWRIAEMLLSVSQSSRARLLLGEYYSYTGDYADAEKYLQLFLQDYPGSEQGLYELGKVYLSTRAVGLAREYFTKASAVGANHPRLFFSMACVELREGHPDRSFAALQAAFARGLTARDLHNGDACLDDIRSEPRLRQLIQQNVGE